MKARNGSVGPPTMLGLEETWTAGKGSALVPANEKETRTIVSYTGQTLRGRVLRFALRAKALQLTLLLVYPQELETWSSSHASSRHALTTDDLCIFSHFRGSVLHLKSRGS